MKENIQEPIPENPEEIRDTDPEKINADVDAIMRKYDRESNTRIWEGKPKIVVGIILALFSLYCIYVTLFANFLEQVRLSSFLGLVIVMGYLTYPAKKGKMQPNYMPWYDILLMVLGAASFFYYTANAYTLLNTSMKLKLENALKQQDVLERRVEEWKSRYEELKGEQGSSDLYHCGHHRPGRSGGTVPPQRRPAHPLRGRYFPGLYGILVSEGREDAGKNCA